MPGPDQDPTFDAASKPVVVTIGHQPFDSALEYGVEQAVREQCGLHLLHVVHANRSGPDSVPLDDDEIARLGSGSLQTAVERATSLLAGRQPVSSALLRGPVVSSILETVEGTARVVVMQRRVLSRVVRTVTRSVTSGVAARAHVPVVSVPSGWSETAAALNHDEPLVTAGVDIPERSAAVVATAAGAARSRGGTLRLLHTWWFPSVYDDIITSRVENDAWAQRAHEQLRSVLAELGEVVAGVPVEIEARHAHPADALIDAGRESSLLVLGRHDPLVPFGSHLGPVARAVLGEATCPVLLANPTGAHHRRSAASRHDSGGESDTVPFAMY